MGIVDCGYLYSCHENKTGLIEINFIATSKKVGIWRLFLKVILENTNFNCVIKVGGRSGTKPKPPTTKKKQKTNPSHYTFKAT